MHELRIPILGYAAVLLVVFLNYTMTPSVSFKYHRQTVGGNWKIDR